jgi:hypothetical protein
LNRRPLEGASRIAAVIIPSRTEPPPFLGLTLHIGFPGLALRIKGIEGLIQAFF